MFNSISIVYANAIEGNTGRTEQSVPKVLRNEVVAILAGRKIIKKELTYKQVCGVPTADDTAAIKANPYYGKAKDNAQLQKLIKEYVISENHAYLVVEE